MTERPHDTHVHVPYETPKVEPGDNPHADLAEKVLDNKEDLPPLPTEGTGTA